MADMKQIFTYPSNSGTDWIDPDYIGNATSGLTMRVDDLLDGTYKYWSNLDPVSDLGTTNSELMKNLSKFINYYEDNKWIENLTFNDFWYNPLVVTTKQLIAADATILLGDTNNPATITTSATHEFEDGMIVRLGGLNGSWATVIGTATDYYIKKIDADELQISKNSGLTDLIGFISTQTIDITSDLRDTSHSPYDDTIKITFPTSYDYPDAMPILINSVEFNGQDMVGNTYYIKEDAAPVYDLYTDSALTNPLEVADIIPFAQEEFTGTLDADATIATIDVDSPITSNETKVFIKTPGVQFAGSGIVWTGAGDGTSSYGSLGNMLHLKATSTTDLWEIYDDRLFTAPVSFNADQEWSVVPYIAGRHTTLDTEPLSMYNLNSWVLNDVSNLTLQAPATGESNYNFAELEGTQVWRGPAISSNNYAYLYTDAALTTPITVGMLDPELFTYVNNGLGNFPFKTDSLELKATGGAVPNSPVYTAQTTAWYAKESIQDYIPASTRVYSWPIGGSAGADQIIYSDSALTTPFESTTFNIDGPTPIDWFPSGNNTDTAQIDISNRSQVLEHIQVQTGNGLADVLDGDEIYLTHLGSGIYNMFTDSAKTLPVKAITYMPTHTMTSVNNGPLKDTLIGAGTINIVSSDVELNDNQLIIYNKEAEMSAYSTGQTMLAADTWYYLLHKGGTSSPWEYYIYEDAAHTTPYNSPSWWTTAAVTDIQTYGGIIAPYNGDQLFTDGYNARAATDGSTSLDFNTTTISGNGQNLASSTMYISPTVSNEGHELYSNIGLTTPQIITDITNDSAGLTKTYQFQPSIFDDGSSNGFRYDASGTTPYPHIPFTRVMTVDGDDSYNGNLKELGARKFIFDETDSASTDNKFLSQAGLLTDATDYYIDYVETKSATAAGPAPTADRKVWGLFTTFDDSSASPVYPTDDSAGAGPTFTNVAEWPETPIEGNARLNYNLYNNSPYDHNGDNILSTHGEIKDDGNSVTLNDPIGHASTFGWFTITTHNNFSDTVAIDEMIRLSPTEKCRYTGYLLNGERLFELVDNSDVKIAIDMADYPSTTVTVTTSPMLPADTTYPLNTPYDFPSTHYTNFHTIADSVDLDERKPYVFWDSSDNFYVGMWTGKKVTSLKSMMFWTKAAWTAGERHLVDTSVPTTLYTGWFALAPVTTRGSSATFNYEDAFTFNNIVGESSSVQTGTNIWLADHTGFYLSQDYSVEGTVADDEPGQPGLGSPGGSLPDAFFGCANTGYLQWILTQDIVVPALQRHTLSNATDLFYISEVTWTSPTVVQLEKDNAVVYNSSYDDTDTTANPYYGYFNHGDIIDLPGVDDTGTASYVLIKRGDNTKLQFRWTDVASPDPTGTDITTEDMVGEVWSVIPLTDWTNAADQGYSGGGWTNNALWVTDGTTFYTPGTTQLNLPERGPIQALPMFTRNTVTYSYPGTYAQSTGEIYSNQVTVRAGNVATGTPYTASQFEFIDGLQTLTHTNKYKVTTETPWELGTVGASLYPGSEAKAAGYAGMSSINGNNTEVDIKRYISSTETNNLYPYEGRLSFDSPCQFIDPAVTMLPAYQGDINVTFGLPLVDATAGTISISPNQPQPYKLDTVDIKMPGNETYSYQDVSNTTIYQGQVDPDHWYEPGTEKITKDGAETAGTFTVGVDGTGKLNSISISTTGRYDSGEEQTILLESPADTYVPPTPTPAELEDVWDTDDEWADYGYADGLKKWPRHVSPMSAEIVYNSPTIVNKSQGGVKYTRSSGHTNWRLDVTYPPMSAEDFQIFAAIAQAGQGQAMPFLFELVNKDNTSILWKDFYDTVNTTVSPLIKNAITPGDTTMLVEGFSSNEADAFVQGEVFIDGENENGNLHTSLSGTDSNIFGEAKIRTTWPFRTAVTAGNKVWKDPSSAVVTLASDDFEYQVDVNNYYYVSVSFDLDSWK